MDREGLLSAVLQWYADERSWVPGDGSLGGRGAKTPRAVADRGRIARAALSAESVGALLTVLCNAHEIPLTALARRARITNGRMFQIVSGLDVLPDEASWLSAALSDMGVR